MKGHPSAAKRRNLNALPGLICACALLTSLLAGSGSGRAPQGAELPAWQALNQGLRVHVAVAALALDPADPRRLYAGLGSGQGVWISDDGGGRGHSVAGALAGRAVNALLTDAARPGLVLAASDAGLYRSADHGVTWRQDAGLPAVALYALAGDRRGGLLAAGAGGLVYRAAAGATPAWRALARLPGAGAVLSLAVLPAAAGETLLAGSDGAGLFRSTDGGQTWQQASEIGRTFVAALAAGEDSRLAVARTRRGLFVTHDAGLTWQQTGSEIADRVDTLAVAAGGDIYAGTGEGALYRQRGGSGPWQRWGSGLDRPGLFQVLQIGAAPRSRWYAGSERGLYLSDDGGLTWQAAGEPGQAAAGTLVAGPDGTLYLGNADGVYRLTAGQPAWQPLGSGLPAGGVLALALAGAGGQTLYAGLPAGLYRSDDRGAHWTATAWHERGVPALLVDPADPAHLWIRAMYERVYESRDGGQSWSARWTGLGLATQVIALAADPGRPGTLYAGASAGFFRSRDGGQTWQAGGAELAGQTVFSLAVGAGPAPSLYAGATNGAYRSADGGEHWARWGEGLENITVSALAFATGDPQRVYAGTKYRGVYASTDGGSHWQPAGPGALSVNALLPLAGTLYAATDQGVYRAGPAAP